MFVPLTHIGNESWALKMLCPGYALSKSYDGILMKNGTVGWNLGFDDVCNEKFAYVAYNNEWGIFEVTRRSIERLRQI